MCDSRLHVPLDGLWGMKIDVPYSLLVRDGPLGWSIGQCPLDEHGGVLDPENLQAQTDHVIGYIYRALASASLPWSAVTKFIVYQAAPDRTFTFDQLSARTNGQALIVPVAIPAFYYPGMLIEVDVYIDLRRDPNKLMISGRGHTLEIVPGSQLAVSKLAIHDTSCTQQAVENLTDVLRELGFTTAGPLVDQWYAADPSLAHIVARHCEQPASCAVTGAGELPLLAEYVHARTNVQGERIVADGVSVVYRRTGNCYWLRAVYDGPKIGHVDQTRACMEIIDKVLHSRSLDFRSVCKSTTYYAGDSVAEDLHSNMEVRNARYCRPGPASTGIPVVSLGLAASRVSIALYGTSNHPVA